MITGDEQTAQADGFFASSEDNLHAKAVEATGLEDFGDPAYRTGLAKLLRSFDEDLERDPARKEACLALALAPLIARLFVEDGLKRYAGSADAGVVAPVFVVGCPRSGTTALHKLLACDERFQGLESWLIKTPMPRPPKREWADNPHYRQAVARFESRLAATPELKFIHYTQPNEVDECLGITAQTFVSNAFGSTAYVPSYDRWFVEQDARPLFATLERNLRLIGANESHKRWLLKNPSHVLDLDMLLDHFPDAMVVHIHRDPLKSMPSTFSLLSKLHRQFDGEQVNLPALVEREIGLWSKALTDAVDIAARHRDRVIEVMEHDMIAAPLEIVQRIYSFAGMELSAQTKQAMHTWWAQHPVGKHGKHRYSAEAVGVTQEALAQRFATYRAHYGFDRQDGEGGR
ncbi:sulfotransferase [Novosphingobium endophyticum]|uniref:Sulfotransferase n=1 Tax=Novosphingobium endophyticum TaxID=1955250 RepID=A0A916X4F5_9SPHN|nr:sulfotransferase [Novosphingobium endophyticum]GGC00535.1 sulfotransferase [Novosphingobium endophyticum]